MPFIANPPLKTDMLHIPLESSTQESAEKIFQQAGISSQEAIQLFCRYVAATGKIPFDIRKPNDDVLAAMQELDERDNLPCYTSMEAVRTFFTSASSVIS